MKLEQKIKIIRRNKISDSRGWFLKIITGREDSLPSFTGEVYMICALPGETRANHYHVEACEWFTLVTGKADMILEDISTKERITISLDSANPQTIFVPANIAHSFANTGHESYMLVTYTDRLYEPSDTISYKF
jgi:dTDP-4-dehydrorhamnose 3,5-epimerase-like enzyme